MTEPAPNATNTPKLTIERVVIALVALAIGGGGSSLALVTAQDVASKTTQQEHTRRIDRHDVEIRELQLVDAAWARDLSYVVDSLSEIKQGIKELREARQ